MIGDRLKKLRGKRSQEDVANNIGISRARLSHYETGRSEPDTATLKKLANLYDVSTDYLINGELSGTSFATPRILFDIKRMVKRKDTLKNKQLLTEIEIEEYELLEKLLDDDTTNFDLELMNKCKELQKYNEQIEYKNKIKPDILTNNELNTQNKEIIVAGQEITLTLGELKLFEELKKHPILFHDLASDPEKKVKELIKLQKMKKLFLEEDDEEYGDGFGELDD